MSRSLMANPKARSRNHSRFRPDVEAVESRALATAHLTAALLHPHAAQVREAAQHRHHNTGAGQLLAPGLGHTGSMHHVSTRGLPGATLGGFLPSNFLDFGVISVWNNTPNLVTFGVSASTVQGGQFFNFTLSPGSYQAYFAPYQLGQAPVFRVSFDPVFHQNPITVTQINTVFKPNNFNAPLGTEGFPYQITLNFGSYALQPI